MAKIINEIGSPHLWFEQSGPEGERLDVLVVRATFNFSSEGNPMTFSDLQSPITYGDELAGLVEDSPLRAILQTDGDLVLYKPGSDVLVFGHATAPGEIACTSWFAAVQVGSAHARLRIHGPRRLRKRWFGWRVDAAVPVTRVPLDYRLAFGGCIDIDSGTTVNGELDTIRFPGNPAGCGWLPTPAQFKHLPKQARQHIKRQIKSARVLAAPQIESATEPLTNPFKPTAVAGLGPIARWWEPRVTLQGSYSNDWRTKRYPLLPADFDSHYFQCAPTSLVVVPHLRGDECISLTGLLPTACEMSLPGWKIFAVVTRKSGDCNVVFLLLDTVRLDLDTKTASLVWRAHFDFEDPVVEVVIAVTSEDAASENVADLNSAASESEA